MDTRQSVIRQTASFARRLAVGLLALVLLWAFVGCSGQVLMPDGSIVNADGSISTGRTDPEGEGNGGTSGITGGTTADPGTESETVDGENTPSGPLPFADDAHRMYVDFLDTGKSDAMILRMDDTVILLDTGDADDYDQIAAVLTAAGIHTVDYMILSHMDNDHIGSADRILQNFTVKAVYMPDYIRQSSRYRALTEALSAVADRTTVYRLQNEDVRLPLAYGEIWINASALYERGQVVNTDTDEMLPSDENNFSLITSVYFGETSLFLPGDAERDRMEEFNALHAATYTLIKTPHHGGYDKGLEAFLITARPTYAIIATDSAASIDPDLAQKLRQITQKRRNTYDGPILFASNGTETEIRQ